MKDSFFEKCEAYLWEYLENEMFEITGENEQYNNICREIEDILDEHSKLRDVFENEEADDLSKEDAEALIKIHGLYLDQRDIEMKTLFYIGGNNYVLFKR